ncbi:hypothetical protein GCM10022393_39770 [Aquimarina addita]|uniref:Uncharacterized protein n=1 Tax=Aquimarina addita TaxID=870485 RepID=A0ABP6UUP1_9FLAO
MNIKVLYNLKGNSIDYGTLKNGNGTVIFLNDLGEIEKTHFVTGGVIKSI